MSWIVIHWQPESGGYGAQTLYNPETGAFMDWSGKTAQYEPRLITLTQPPTIKHNKGDK